MSGDPFYTSAEWRRIRWKVLQRDRRCRWPGCQRIATHVDHVIPRRRGGSDDPSNLMGLCGTCHNSHKQSLEKTGRVRGCDANGFPIDPRHPWNEQKISEGCASKPVLPSRAQKV